MAVRPTDAELVSAIRRRLEAGFDDVVSIEALDRMAAIFDPDPAQVTPPRMAQEPLEFLRCRDEPRP